MVKEVVNVNGFVFKRKVDPAAASARTEDAAEPAPAPAEERQDSQASFHQGEFFSASLRSLELSRRRT